jgi:hypothetical protein
MRFPLGIFWQCTIIVVLFFLGFSTASRWTKYGVMIMSVCFSIGTFILAWPTISINVAGRTKKSFFGGSSLITYCIGNIIGSQVMRPSDAPLYRKGMTICGVMMILNIANTLVWWWHYKRENKRRDAEFLASGLTEEERDHQNFLAGETDLTDMQVSLAPCGKVEQSLTTEPSLPLHGVMALGAHLIFMGRTLGMGTGLGGLGCGVGLWVVVVRERGLVGLRFRMNVMGSSATLRRRGDHCWWRHAGRPLGRTDLRIHWPKVQKAGHVV